MALASRTDMQALYGNFYACGAGIDIDAADVPPAYRNLARYASFWGIGDDWSREELVAKAPSVVRRDLAMAVLGRHHDMFVSWLGGPESYGPHFSKAYLAYTHLIMAAEAAHITEQRAGWDWKPTPYRPPTGAKTDG
jgi:hypothetical protein